jgi:hypothetical protein
MLLQGPEGCYTWLPLVIQLDNLRRPALFAIFVALHRLDQVIEIELAFVFFNLPSFCLALPCDALTFVENQE